MNNPTNIENDIILEHGNWCLNGPSGARSPENRARIQSIMDQRRDDLTAGRVAYCEGTTL